MESGITAWKAVLQTAWKAVLQSEALAARPKSNPFKATIFPQPVKPCA
jgi:hypothetical protein